MNETLELCLCQEEESLETFLKQCLGLSGQKIKSSTLTKNQLNRKLKKGEQLCLPIELINWREICPTPHQGIKVIGETQDWVALHKSHNVHTHPHGYETETNLIGWMASQEELARYIHVNSNQYDRGALWRLDYETSGVVVVAKTSEFYEKLRSQFSSLVKKKYYLAIVENCPEEKSLKHHLLPSEKKGRKMIEHPKGELANLKLVPLVTQNNKTVLLVELAQGLRHQIRVQLSLAGSPIVGDTLYGGAEAARLYLHCFRYDFLETCVVDEDFELFTDLVDLNRLLQVLSDMGLRLKS